MMNLSGGMTNIGSVVVDLSYSERESDKTIAFV